MSEGTPKPMPVMDNGAAGGPLRTKHRVLETGAGIIQEFHPVKQICAFLNAFHLYAKDPARCVEANHYCSHITEGARGETSKSKYSYLIAYVF